MFIRFRYLFILAILFGSCKKSEDSGDGAYPLSLPPHFPQPVFNLEQFPVTQNGFELGRKLFFDPRLSSTHQISCGDCHQQYAGFAHADHITSHGIHDRDGLRNSQHLVNLIYQKNFFWDGGVSQLDLVSVRPLTDTLEMGNTISNVLHTLNQIPEYRDAFKKAFPAHRDTISTTLLLKALSQFMAALVSADSPYDKFVLGEQTALSESAKRGLKIFESKCNTCHTAPLFTDGTFRRNGLPDVTDIGRADVTLEDKDKYHFKVPSLRNLSLTSPYMHDGRFRTIEDVINFYSDGITKGSHVDPALLLPEGNGFRFTAEEKADLKAFLLTLTDKNFSTNKNFFPK